MYDSSKSRSFQHSLGHDRPNLRTSRPAHMSKYSNERPVLQSTRCPGGSLGCEPKSQSPCYLHIHAPNTGMKVECSSGKRDFAVERIERMNEREQDLRKLLEADSIRFSARAHARKYGGLPQQDRSACIDDASNLDMTPSYETFSDFDTFLSDLAFVGAFDGAIPGCTAESQTANLCGIGRWMDEVQGSAWISWQLPTTSMDVTEDQCLDLARIHNVAIRHPFKLFFRAQREEWGALNFQMYSLLP